MNRPKGKLISIGGAEDKGTQPEPNFIQKNNLHFFELSILKRFVEEAGGLHAHIEVITTASMIPDEVGANYFQAFQKLGCTNVHLLGIRKREEAANPDYIERISRADGVMFSGGNQLRLSTVFGGTEILRMLQNRYLNEPGFILAGTSAGAMAMSNTMIYLGVSSEAHLKGSVKITTGLGFMQNVIVDSHFERRGRFGRLAQAVISNPSCIGVGLGEDTAVVVTEGNFLECIGSGPVVIIDGHESGHTNIADVPIGTPVSAEHLVVHFLTKGNSYDLSSRKFSTGRLVGEVTEVLRNG